MYLKLVTFLDGKPEVNKFLTHYRVRGSWLLLNNPEMVRDGSAGPENLSGMVIEASKLLTCCDVLMPIYGQQLERTSRVWNWVIKSLMILLAGRALWRRNLFLQEDRGIEMTSLVLECWV